MLGIYINNNLYNRPDNQPGVITCFVIPKEENLDPIAINNFASSRIFAIIPLISSFTGLIRMARSLVVIFKETKKMLFQLDGKNAQEVKNGCKNFLQGAIELVPILGNITLLFFFSIESVLSSSKGIERVMVEKGRGVAGILFDGKIIETIKIDDVICGLKRDPNLSKKNEFCLEILRLLCTRICTKYKNREESKQFLLPKLFKKSIQEIKNRSFANSIMV